MGGPAKAATTSTNVQETNSFSNSFNETFSSVFNLSDVGTTKVTFGQGNSTNIMMIAGMAVVVVILFLFKKG